MEHSLFSTTLPACNRHTEGTKIACAWSAPVSAVKKTDTDVSLYKFHHAFATRLGARFWKFHYKFRRWFTKSRRRHTFIESRQRAWSWGGGDPHPKIPRFLPSLVVLVGPLLHYPLHGLLHLLLGLLRLLYFITDFGGAYVLRLDLAQYTIYKNTTAWVTRRLHPIRQ